ncbi:hypothetical protein SLNSH_17615 [Alsobacter soli]|uniref:Putative Flp pilus-assembly TadG-like N-terminal domain-containing protein n=1 Tax=Alsobacter soli TaxID=2109933 RepID=A0A2T1HQF5_9HYPH|nr:pilus assembly protein TadG-related protein [Alsobacter soli]PSC03759.1 hypothetical protein SLNSH_17615 [Alsobacter soli]
MSLRRLLADEGGSIAIPMAVALPVIAAAAMLVVDGGRLFNLQTSVQTSADALALAGAAELDGKPDAIQRSNAAIAALVRNDPRFGAAGGRIGAQGVRYLTGLPTSDATAIGSAYQTTDPARAALVEVTTQPVGFGSVFAKAAGAVGLPTAVSAKAVAGFDSVACNVTPLFMCNPFEGSSTTLFTAARDPSFKRRLIAMKAKGSQYGAGNYGYLQPAYGTGGSAVKESLAVDRPKGCYRQSGVELQTGNISSTAEALNVRFDLYSGNFSGSRGDPSYRPAQNVRKGFTGPSCNPSVAYDPTQSPTASANLGKPLGLPRDTCFLDGRTCTYGGSAVAGRIGDGDWDFETYWTRTYGGGFPNGWSNTNRPSRYDVYRYELDNDLQLRLTAGASAKESGAPACYTGGPSTLSDDPDRRTFVGAIIDCAAAAAAGQLTGSSGGVIPVTAYGRFFLTEPMDKNDGTIWAEMVELVEPGTASARGIIRDSVELYR